MEYYSKEIDLGITNNPMGQLATWGEDTNLVSGELKKAGFRMTRFGTWVGPTATVKNYAAAVKAVFGVDVDTAGLSDAKPAEWA